MHKSGAPGLDHLMRLLTRDDGTSVFASPENTIRAPELRAFLALCYLALVQSVYWVGNVATTRLAAAADRRPPGAAAPLTAGDGGAAREVHRRRQIGWACLGASAFVFGQLTPLPGGRNIVTIDVSDFLQCEANSSRAACVYDDDDFEDERTVYELLVRRRTLGPSPQSSTARFGSKPPPRGAACSRPSAPLVSAATHGDRIAL